MRKLITHNNALEMDWDREKNNGPSLTLPDQAISPQELLRRYATGQPLGFGNSQPVYDSDHEGEIPEFYKMDKLDRLHALQENSHNLVEKRQNFNAEKEKFLAKKKEQENAEKAKNETKKEKTEQSSPKNDSERSDSE